jgi:hypothetical protein
MDIAVPCGPFSMMESDLPHPVKHKETAEPYGRLDEMNDPRQREKEKKNGPRDEKKG